jgi:Ser/Thr protein kinase RdoA (MazF antagonist)
MYRQPLNEGEADPKTGTSGQALAQYGQIAERALAHYLMANAQCHYLGHSGGAAFRVETPNVREAHLLKVHTHPRGGRPVLESGLLWLAALAQETDLTVQEPVRDGAGRLVVAVQMPDEQGRVMYCSLVRWVEGEHFLGAPSWREQRPVPCSSQWATRLGEMVARLHQHASRWTLPPGFERPRYDAARMYAWLRDLWLLVKEGRITPADYGILERAAQQVDRLMAELGQGGPHWGLVHADLCPDNYVIYGNEVRPLDFDLCGFSYYLLDVAYALLWHSARNRRAFLEGYRRLRTLPTAYQQHIEAFTVWGVIAMLKFWAPAPALIARTCARYVRGEAFLFD